MGFTAHYDDHSRGTRLPAHIDHELLEVSRSAFVMTTLMLRDESLIAITKSLAQYGKTFKSSYNVSLDEARISSIRKDSVSCTYL